jgi:hypothetical protein
MKKISYFMLLLLLSVSAAAQSNIFVIYSMKGDISVVENKVETKAKIGKILNGDAMIKLAPGSFATLLCNETRLFSLNKTGNYTTGKLADSCKVNNSSFSATYLKYIWNEFTKPKGSPEKNRKAYMANVGAVSRSINNVWIDPKLDTVYYVSGTIPLSWKSYTDAEEFEFKLFDAVNLASPVFTKTIKKKHIDISDLLKNIQTGKTYYWTAMIKGEDNEERKLLRYWTKDEYTHFYSGIKKVNGASEGDAETNFRLGFLLEEAHFLADAYNHYLKATQLAPDNPLYRFTFMSFKKDYEIK